MSEQLEGPSDGGPRSPADFRADAMRALGVWRAHPLLPVCTFGIAALSAATAVLDGPVVFVVGMAGLALIGWPGVERLWYLRAYTGRSLPLSSLLRANFAYFGRFFVLGCLILLALVPLSIVVVVAAAAAGQGTDWYEEGSPWWLVAASALLMLIIDMALTFVTPALVYTTDRVTQAIRIGLSLLRSTWPHCLLYVIVPPLAVLLFTQTQTDDVGVAGGVLILVSTMVNLLAKGATAAYYLRLLPLSPGRPDGAID